MTPGAHDYDPKNSFKINQTDTYVAPISPHLRNNAMKQSFDVYSILSLIVGTAVPLIVAATIARDAATAEGQNQADRQAAYQAELTEK